MTQRLAMFLAATLVTSAPMFAANEPAAPQGPGSAASAAAGMPADCPMHAQHMAASEAAKRTAETPTGHDHQAMNMRGEQGMGFSQSATTHHFLLKADGGEIRVEANDPQDATSRDQIRRHLFEIARSFAAGDFKTPMFIHDQIPPGVPVLERVGAAVDYAYADTDRGGRVQIHTTNAEALQAIQEFLRFQIQEHQTGDPLQPAS